MEMNVLETLERIVSDDGKIAIDVVRMSDGSFALRKFVKMYDNEEGVSYEVMERPHPGGKYINLEKALEYARLQVSTA